MNEHSDGYLAARNSLLIGVAFIGLFTRMLVAYAVAAHDMEDQPLTVVHGWLAVAGLAEICSAIALRRVAGPLSASMMATHAFATLAVYVTC